MKKGENGDEYCPKNERMLSTYLFSLFKSVRQPCPSSFARLLRVAFFSIFVFFFFLASSLSRLRVLFALRTQFWFEGWGIEKRKGKKKKESIILFALIY